MPHEIKPSRQLWKPKARYLGYRLYHDFLMPSRLDEYGELLQLLVLNSYVFVTIRDFSLFVSGEATLPGAHIALLRHDIDSDLKTARAMFALERKFAVRSTYYFRLNTVDVPFMRELEAEGSEVGYHYEEIAT